jgi:DUF1680 family protein
MNIHTYFFLIFLLLANACTRVPQHQHDYPIRPVSFTQVRTEKGFWHDRIEINRTVTIPYDFRKCEETGRISNFAKAGGLQKGKFEGIFFNDSDLYKVIEGAAYSLAQHPDAALEHYVDSIIHLIAAAQEPDGYLYTNRTIDPTMAADGAGTARWTHLKDFHELYNVGHLYEAAVAWYEATGRGDLLEVALKNADLVVSVFGPGKNRGVPGHEEIEIGLVKLYRVTGDKKYLDLAKFFVDERGNAAGHKLYGPYYQDSLPIRRETEARGHAVRAGYFYSAVADVAALTGDTSYLSALNRIWEDVVDRKIYLTGGVGAQRRIEGFGAPYELPNATAYNETCAAVATMLWNHRMFLLEGEAKYMNVFERTLYNGFLSGISLTGNRFFYPNPLESDGEWKFNMGSVDRSPWFHCSCCPVNIVRFIPSVPGYVYAVRKDTLYVNLFINSVAELALENNRLRLEQITDYPWSGKVSFVYHGGKMPAVFMIRVPDWAQGKVMDGQLYRFVDEDTAQVFFHLNGMMIRPGMQRGYAVVERRWQEGDTLVMDLPMVVRRVVADERVADDRGKIAIERGPLVYCVEGVDEPVHPFRLMLPADVRLETLWKPHFLDDHGLMVLRGKALVKPEKDSAGAAMEEVPLTMIPYYAWDHRGNHGMRVWMMGTMNDERRKGSGVPVKGEPGR